MNWTLDKLQSVPEVYRDFMLILKPIIDSRKPDVILRIGGIPFGKFYDALATRYGYTAQQVEAVAENLRRQGLVEKDDLGFFKPTGAGEVLILALSDTAEALDSPVPPFPTFEESR